MNAKCAWPALMIAALSAGTAAASFEDDAWEPYRFLVGEWTADGGGEPGNGSGRFSFAWDLKEKVLVRRNRAEYPAAQGRPAFSHEDLMVIYRADRGGPAKAIYFDSEDHVINYAVTFSSDRRTLTFLSDAVPAAPRFRLSYTRAADESMKIQFEIAPPGKPDGFKTYLEGKAHRWTQRKPGGSRVEDHERRHSLQFTWRRGVLVIVGYSARETGDIAITRYVPRFRDDRQACERRPCGGCPD